MLIVEVEAFPLYLLAATESTGPHQTATILSGVASFAGLYSLPPANRSGPVNTHWRLGNDVPSLLYGTVGTPHYLCPSPRGIQP